MSGYGLPDPYGLLDGQPQMQIFVVENAKIILRPPGGWFLPEGGKQVSFSYRVGLNEWPFGDGKTHRSTLGMFAGNGAPNSNTAFCIVSRFPQQRFAPTGNDDASQFVSRVDGVFEKARQGIAGASVCYSGPDFSKPYIPLILPTPLYGILTSEEWAQGAKLINTAWRGYYDPHNDPHFCDGMGKGNNLLYAVGAFVVIFLLLGLSGIDGPAGRVFGVLAPIYVVGLAGLSFYLFIKSIGDRVVKKAQPMWTALREAHENAFGRKVRITWTPTSDGRKGYAIDKFCVEILQNGSYSGQQQQIIMGQQPMLQQQMVMGQQPMPQQQMVMGQQPMPQQQMLMGQQPMLQQQMVMGQQPMPQQQMLMGQQPMSQQQMVVGQQPV